MPLARLLICDTLTRNSAPTPACALSSASPASTKRSARSRERASTTCRDDRSSGRLARSPKAFINSLVAAPRPPSPSLNTSSSLRSCASRVASMAEVERAAAASRVRKASWARVTDCTSTPRPKKPAPVNWPSDVVSDTCCRE
jgi:hypothetical protein